MLKLFIKEDIVPANANRFVHTLAPIISIAVALVTFAVIPFGNTISLFGREIKLMIADVNIGVLYILALTSLGVYGITLSGWSSNNKYSLLGGLRSSAQLISYELSMGLSIVGVIMVAGTLQLDRIVELPGASPGTPSSRRSGSSRLSLPRSPRPTGCRSICRRRSRSWWEGITPNIPA